MSDYIEDSRTKKAAKDVYPLNPDIRAGQAKGIEGLLGIVKASAGIAFGATALTIGSPLLAVFAPLIDRMADALVPSFEKDLIAERLALLHRCVLEQENRFDSVAGSIARADESIRILDGKLNAALAALSPASVYDLVKQSVRLFETADDRTYDSLIRMIAHTLTRGPQLLDLTKQLLDSILSLSDSDRFVLFKVLHDVPASATNIERFGSGVAIGAPITFSRWRIRLKDLGLSEQALQQAFLNRMYNAGLIALSSPNDLQNTQLRTTALTNLLRTFIPKPPDGGTANTSM